MLEYEENFFDSCSFFFSGVRGSNTLQCFFPKRKYDFSKRRCSEKDRVIHLPRIHGLFLTFLVIFCQECATYKFVSQEIRLEFFSYLIYLFFVLCIFLHLACFTCSSSFMGLACSAQENKSALFISSTAYVPAGQICLMNIFFHPKKKNIK